MYLTSCRPAFANNFSHEGVRLQQGEAEHFVKYVFDIRAQSGCALSTTELPPVHMGASASKMSVSACR